MLARICMSVDEREERNRETKKLYKKKNKRYSLKITSNGRHFKSIVTYQTHKYK